MTAASQPVAATTTPTFADIARQFPEWVKKNIVATIVSAIVSGVIGYVFNVWLMAVRYEGSVTPAGAPATSKDNFISGGLFWAMLPMLACSIVGYRRAVGRERFWADVRGLPMMLVGLVRREGAQGRVHLLWGAGIALAASLIVSPAVGAVLGIGILLSAPSIIGQMVSSLVAQVWHRVAQQAKPNAPAQAQAMPPAMSAMVGLLGASIALVAGFVLPGRTIRIVLAVACVAAALYLGQQAKAAGAVALVIVVAGTWAVAEVVFASPAFADDGGFAECGSTIQAWLENCAGADVVRRLAGAGGLIAALAGPLGTFLGGLISGFVPPGGGGPWWDSLTGGGQPPRGGGTTSDGTGGTTNPFSGATAEGSATYEGEDDRPERYHQNPVDVKGERPTPLDADKGHTVDPEGRAVGPDGEPLKDPRTGKDLPVDTEGKVKYGQEWMSPEQAAERARIDAETLEARRKSQELIDKAKNIKGQLDDPELPWDTRRQLEEELRKTAIDINSDYSAKSQLKGDKTGLADALDGEIKKIYGEVDPAFVEKMKELGITRGGEPFSKDDMWDVRNQSSKGLGMDRDFALNQKEIVRIREELAAAEPGSERAHVLQQELFDAQRKGDLAMDKNKYAEFLEAQKAGKTQLEIERIDKQIESIKAAPGDKVPISPSMWNAVAQDAYGKAYGEVTGADAHKAMQGVTQIFNPEAYDDPNAIRNDVRNSPMDRARAEQTASVSPYKTFHNDEMTRGDDPVLTKGEAMMENARGYAKDMDTKLLPLLQSDPNVDPAKLGRLQAIQETMAAIGRGDILPGQADGALKVATGDPNITMDSAMRQVDANLEAGIKGHPGVTTAERVGDVFGKATDLAAFENLTKQAMAEGKSLNEAMALAATQTAAGNLAMATGAVNPTLSMVAGSMLPGGVGNILPDQMAENTAKTGWDAASALGSDIKATYESGELSTAAIDKFAESVAARGNADPFSGFGQAAGLAGDLYERTDGGSLGGDLEQIYQTGAGAEVLNESMANFQQQVESGQHGVVLEGYNEILGAAAELAADPAGTVGQFVDDVSNIITNGVGDGYWEQAGMQAKEVIDKTPVVGMVAGGYEAIAEGIGESGVTGFVSEMGEGAAALGGEAVEAVADAGSSAIDYIKSFF